VTVLPTALGEPQPGATPEYAIRLENVAKAYKMYDKPSSFLKEALTGRPYHRDKRVLSDISLTIPRGQVVGVIGRNGAGKSTLLKIISRTLAPSQGTVTVNGRVSAILELGTGFNPNYSGRDNVILSSLMRGMSEDAVRRKFDSIVAFAGLEDVIDEPFHTYSSGMQARLAFAAAVSVEADVLVIDEALAAGDIRFTTKSLGRIHEICKSGVTALFVSHQTYHVMQLCSRAIWIDQGRVRMDGPPIEVVRAYDYEMHEAIARDQGRMQTPVIMEPEPVAPPPEPVLVVPAPEPAPEMIETAASVPPVATESSPASASDDTAAAGRDAAAEPQPQPAAEMIPDAPPEGLVAAEVAPDIAPDPEGEPAAPAAPPVPEADLPATEPTASTEDQKKRRFSSGEYRILDIVFLDKTGRRIEAFRFGETLRMRVVYERLLPELPKYSCGLAVAFNRVSDFEAVMYFNTNYPHSDEELTRYFQADFRKYIGQRGMIEAVIEPVQLCTGEYYVSLGLLPNQPGMHEFYEYIGCYCTVSILSNGFNEPSVFYPLVKWTNGPIE
jgi:ABC-type polysaccharide/polyol phosphate transport system ATPase subunit